ncbi:MAG: hypothetical protein KGL39_15450 [Patescibacteria group bacterium]|nr:hypothetical protein [Patescibacteria group bacterium]
MDDIVIEGYVREVGDIGMGLRGGKPGKGVVLEVTGAGDIEIRGLSKEQCRALAGRSMELVRLTLSAEPKP